jgi:hypothetical protein
MDGKRQDDEREWESARAKRLPAAKFADGDRERSEHVPPSCGTGRGERDAAADENASVQIAVPGAERPLRIERR